MQITINLTDQHIKFILNNLYPFICMIYRRYGGNQIMFQQNKVFDIWWSKPSVLFPYLFSVDDVPAGFAFVVAP